MGIKSVFAVTLACSCVFSTASATVPISDNYLLSDIIVEDTILPEYNVRAAKDKFKDLSSNEVSAYASISSDARNKVVAAALKEVGTKEGSINNDIKYNDWYVPTHRYVGRYPPYCAIFVCWALNEAGMWNQGSVGPPAIDSAACNDFVDKYAKYGRFMYAWSDYTPQPGDIVLFTNYAIGGYNVTGYNSYHTGLVYKLEGDQLFTIEGNTSPDRNLVNAEGHGVWLKSYNFSKEVRVKGKTRVLGFAIPWYPGSEEINSLDGLTMVG